MQTRTYISFNTGPLVDGQPDFTKDFEVLGSVDGRYFDQDRFTPTTGRLPDPARLDEIAINETTAKLLGYRVGDHLDLGTYSDDQVNDPAFFDNPTPPKREDAVTIVGIGLFPEEVVQDDYDRSSLVLLTPAFTAAARPLATYAWQGLILAHGDADIDAIKQYYVSRLPPDAPQFFRTTSIDEFHALQSMRPVSVALGAFGGIALLAALLLGGQAIARRLRFERDERAAWRALGARPGTAIGAAVAPIALTVVGGAALAVVVAVAASPAMPIGPVRRVEVASGFDVDLTVLGFGAAALALALVGVALFVAWREAPQRVAGHAQVTPRSRVVTAAASAGMSPPAVAGLRLAFEPGDGATAVPVRSVMATVAIAVAALVAALTFASSLNHLVNRPSLYGWDWGGTLWAQAGYGNVDGPNTDEVLGADEHVAGWSSAWFGSGLIDGRNLPLLGMRPGSAVTPPLASGRPTASTDEIVLGTATIAALHKAVGDTVRLGDDRDGRELTIVG
ncbi:MAG: hypothetical protein ABIV94_11445, partial [Acidimicrobiales bacterium]